MKIVFHFNFFAGCFGFRMWLETFYFLSVRFMYSSRLKKLQSVNKKKNNFFLKGFFSCTWLAFDVEDYLVGKRLTKAYKKTLWGLFYVLCQNIFLFLSCLKCKKHNFFLPEENWNFKMISEWKWFFTFLSQVHSTELNDKQIVFKHQYWMFTSTFLSLDEKNHRKQI